MLLQKIVIPPTSNVRIVSVYIRPRQGEPWRDAKIKVPADQPIEFPQAVLTDAIRILPVEPQTKPDGTKPTTYSITVAIHACFETECKVKLAISLAVDSLV